MGPFKPQVRLLRQTMRAQHVEDVDIGLPEAYQGREHGVVILCVTRSSKHLAEKDKELDRDIIGQPKKLNVALTTAKLGLIIMGNRDVLVNDPYWRVVLDFCCRNRLVAGNAGTGDIVWRDGPLTRFEREALIVGYAGASNSAAAPYSGGHLLGRHGTLQR
ncbi:hypothetical protein GE09DRAFT_410694 [Coniochaeta sp. 2T2.1]|nr:hypothetical protein GE09DRAFT_410694 [Coniochaeta sp. 2T2.1]